MVFVGYVFEEESAVRWHAPTNAQSETKETETEHWEGIGETGCYTEEGSQEQSAIESSNAAERIRV